MGCKRFRGHNGSLPTQHSVRSSWFNHWPIPSRRGLYSFPGLSHVLTFFASPSLSCMSTLVFLFSPLESVDPSLPPKPGPVLASAGVGKTSGLGRTAELRLFRPESYHSLKKLLGLGNRSVFMYRLGKADIGVSILFRLSPYASRFWFDVGGGGRAKGLGGPDAPADMTAEALGEGGGRTI